MDLNRFKEEVHANAVAHGWWEGDRPRADVVALIHSEWSEALEAYRNGEQLVWKTDAGKPEGVGVELIDGVIRSLDAADAWGIRLFEDDEQLEEAKNRMRANGYADCTLPELVCTLHKQTSHLLLTSIETVLRHNIETIVALVFTWIDMQGDDPYLILREKHEYNKTRPYKHGGKRI